MVRLTNFVPFGATDLGSFAQSGRPCMEALSSALAVGTVSTSMTDLSASAFHRKPRY